MDKKKDRPKTLVKYDSPDDFEPERREQDPKKPTLVSQDSPDDN